MTEPELKLVDILAIDRTRMAAQRSLMAWVRTALSMITFGFTFYKFMPWDLAFIVACLLALLGLLMFGSVIVGSGPFG